MTTANLETARKEILGLVRAAWESAHPGVTLLFENVRGEAPTSADSDHWAQPWARLSTRHFGGEQVSLADSEGLARFEHSGVVTVQVFSPLGQGFEQGSPSHDAMVQTVLDAVRGQRTTSGVTFYDPRPVDVGPNPDGPWYQTNVVAEFRYDQLK